MAMELGTIQNETLELGTIQFFGIGIRHISFCDIGIRHNSNRWKRNKAQFKMSDRSDLRERVWFLYTP